MLVGHWRPDDLTLNVGRSCRCGTVAAACTEICPNSTAPAAYVSVRARTVYRGMIADLPLNETEVLRVR